MKKTILAVFLALALSLVLISKVQALTTDLAATKDTYIRPGVDGSQGGDSVISLKAVGSPNSYTTYAFVAFDFGSLLDDYEIDRARLKMSLLNDISGGFCNLSAQRQGSDWPENADYFSLGYSNTGITYHTTTLSASQDYYWELTELVRSWQRGDFPNYGVVLILSDECEKELAARENSNTGSRPTLIVEYHARPTPTPTPTNTPTPTLTLTPSPTPVSSSTATLTPKPSLSEKATISPTVSSEDMIQEDLLEPSPAMSDEADKPAVPKTIWLSLGVLGISVIGLFVWLVWQKKIDFNKLKERFSLRKKKDQEPPPNPEMPLQSSTPNQEN